ncbi:hypothetical protein, partial [Bacillus sp. SIMBA_005]|uniref:hypothetical protein n=1 Tax=Bacillus sp. SIMBA_005 TaxID=3085754 RepID=UPI00397AECC7
ERRFDLLQPANTEITVIDRLVRNVKDRDVREERFFVIFFATRRHLFAYSENADWGAAGNIDAILIKSVSRIEDMARYMTLYV